jgi:U3 small nucleolar RNA-associated protein 25
MVSYPFLDDDVEPSDVTCKLMYSKYDWFRMERIAGTDEANNLFENLRETKGL